MWSSLLRSSARRHLRVKNPSEISRVLALDGPLGIPDSSSKTQEKCWVPARFSTRVKTQWKISEAKNFVRSFSTKENKEEDLEHDDDDSDHEFSDMHADDDDDEDESESVKNAKPLFRVALHCKPSELMSSLEQWLSEGNVLNKHEFSFTLRELYKRKMFGTALKISNWLLEKKPFKYRDHEYACHIDLIAKVEGLFRAEKYLDNIPAESKGSQVYGALLWNCYLQNNLQKAEELFNRMKDSGIAPTVNEYNKLLMLYRRQAKKKIVHLINSMEVEGVKPNALTYKLLIEAKGQVGDINGMEQIVKNMKSEVPEIPGNIHLVLAKHYANAGMVEKADFSLKELEKHLTNRVYLLLQSIPVYATLGRDKDVERLSERVEALNHSNLRWKGYLSCLTAWGKLGQVDKAELMFNKAQNCRKMTAEVYSQLLDIYADHNLEANAKDLIKKMTGDGIKANSSIWDPLVRLYVNLGDLEKAIDIMSKASVQKEYKPKYMTIVLVLNRLADKGDIPNAEKCFQIARQFGYKGRIELFESLLQAYVSAGVPSYGFKERMMADKCVPSRHISILLQNLEKKNKDIVEELF